MVLPEPDTPVTTVSRPLGRSTARGFTVWIAPVARWMGPLSEHRFLLGLVGRLGLRPGDGRGLSG